MTWWNDPENVNELCWWLIGKHRLTSAQDCQNVHDHPHRWTLEYTDMLAERFAEKARRIFVGA